MNATALGLAAFAIAAANTAWFFGRMRRVALPLDRSAHEALWAASVALGVAAFAIGVNWVGGIAAALGIAVGAGMLLLRLGSPQARNVPAVAVGGPILDFTAPDEHDAPFALSSLAGKPFLLKFFRGHW